MSFSSTRTRKTATANVHLCLLLILPFLLALASRAQDIAKPTNAGRIAGLIVQLGSPRYGERQKAARALDALGTAALLDLAKASSGDDAEVRRRAGLLIEQITRRDQTEKLLAATEVQLNYKDAPVSEVVADLVKKTGFRIIVLQPSAGEKITLNSGKMSFWKAIDLLCAKAQIAEAGELHAVALGEVKHLFVATAGPKAPFRLVLLEGAYPAMPTSYHLGARIRALPSTIPLVDLSRANDEKVFALEISLDPARRLYSIIAARIDGAIDSRGVHVAATTELLRKKNHDANPYRGYDMAVPAYITRLELGMGEGNFRRVLIRVKASKMLKELHGVLSVEVQKPAGPLFTVDDIFKATRKSFSGPDGGAITLNGSVRKANGTVEIQVETSYPMGGVRGPLQIRNGGVLARRGASGPWEPIGIQVEKLILQDREGRAYARSVARANGVRFMGGGLCQTMTLTYAPPNAKSAPGKLIYHGELTTFVDVPFKLKNVPLQ